MDINYAKQFEPINGKWYITKELGNGAFGTVFEIERRDFTNEKSALKIIPVPATQGEVNSYIDENDDADENSVSGYFYGYVEEFISEFKLMSKFKGNSNIVSIEDYDVIERKDRFGWDILIRMELLTPLSRYYRENIPTQNDIIRLGIDICKALELCQKYNIIHRDVKPSNIFVSENGEYKLGDFGVAKVLGKTSSMSKKGTYTYMAPEVYKGDNYSANVDLYSLGSVMYKLLNNKLEMFRIEKTHADEFKALETRIMGQKEIPAPANADAALSAVILKACSYNPSDRYQSPTEMREALECLLEGKPSKKPAPIVTPVVDALDVDTGTVGVFTKKKPINKPAYSNEDADMVYDESITTEKPKKSKNKTIFAAVTSVLVIVIAAVLGFAFTGNKNDVVASSTTNSTTEQVNEDVETDEPSTEESTSELTEESTESSTEETTEEKSTNKDESTTNEPTTKNNLPVQTEWSAWKDELPKYVTDNLEHYETDTLTLSKKRELKNTTSEKDVEKLKKDGWELYDTVEADEGYSPISAWSSEKPANKSGRDIYSEERYRYQTKETKNSSTANLSGWILENTTFDWSSYGGWSEWSTTPAYKSDYIEVDEKIQYSYREKEYKESKEANLSGWDFEESKPEYGNWSAWSTTEKVASSTLEVDKSKVMYRYYYYACKSCGNRQPYWGTSCTSCGKKVDNSTKGYKWVTTSYKDSGYTKYDSAKSVTTKIESGKKWFFSTGNLNDNKVGTKDKGNNVDPAVVIKQGYRTRSKTIIYTYSKWTNWSDWTSEYLEEITNERERREQKVYRYRERTKIATYHYCRWSELSDWTNVKKFGSDIRVAEQKTFYRYRDKINSTTYYLRRWTDWKEVPNGTAAENNDIKIKVQYRFRSK